MATYHVALPDGSEYNIDAANDAQAQDAVTHLTKPAPQWSDIPGNVVQGIKEAPQTAAGMINGAKTAMSIGSPLAWAHSAVQAVNGTPLAETQTGQALGTMKDIVHGAAGDVIQGAKDFAAHPLDTIKNQIIEHPISTAAMVAPVAEELTGAGRVGADYAARFGENQAVKATGARMGQIGELGRDESRALARRMTENNVINPLRGSIGLENKVADMHDTAGANIGAARDMADARDAAAGETTAPQTQALLDLAKQRFGPSYESGKLAPRAGTFNRVLETVQNPVIDGGQMTPQTTGTFAGNAAKATELNAEATPDMKLTQSKDSPYTDLANLVSHQNNDAMGNVLTPDEMAAHKQDLQDFTDTTHLQKLMASGEKREMAGRGSGSLTKTLYDRTMDSVGNRTAAWLGIHGSNVADAAVKNTGSVGAAGVTARITDALTKNPSSLGKFAAPLAQAAQSGGSQGIAATHFILSQNYPEYNALWASSGQEGQTEK